MRDATPTKRVVSRAARADLYRHAAEIMATRDELAYGSCCWSIALAKDPSVDFLPDQDDDCRALKAMYAPKGRAGYWLWNIGDTDEERHNGRLLALCFMAAMVEAGDA